MDTQEAFRLELLKTGLDYYVIARASWSAGIDKVTGNLFHHAIEMLLKAALLKFKTPEQVRQYDHSLTRLWNPFKARLGGSELDGFDDAIQTLNAFEKIRYPDSIVENGAAIHIELLRDPGVPMGAASVDLSNPEKKPLPKYILRVQEMDAIVAAILSASSVDPKVFISSFNASAREPLLRGNEEKIWDFLR